MPAFRLITEGITDQIVIENILFGFFDNKDLEITFAQPLRDATDEDIAKTDGNWHKVLEYCGSDVFKGMFSFEDNYAIIQIDTDVFFGNSMSAEYAIKTRNNEGGELNTAGIYERILEKLIEIVGKDFYQENKEKIIFAISIHSLECWLLPFYFANNKKGKIVSCLNTLNPALKREFDFTISAKEPDYYRTASKIMRKHKTFMEKYKDNFSLDLFITELSDRNIEMPDEDDW